MIVLRYLLTVLIAYLSGKLIQKIRLPAIIGWLFTGAVLGPHLLNIMSTDVTGSSWYGYVMVIGQMCVGALIGFDFRWKKLEENGTDILKLTLSQMSGSFIVVFLVGAIICKLLNIPIVMALLFANISIALAPAPTLATINQYKTKGPLTDTVIPVTVTNSILANLVFYTIISIVHAKVSTTGMNLFMTLTFLMFIPILMGSILGILSSRFIKNENKAKENKIISIILFLAVAIIGYLVNNYLYPEPIMNYILLGMSFIAGISNLISTDLADKFESSWSSIVNAGLLVIIVNSSVSINIRLLSSVGWVSLVYVLARGLGWLSGNYLGSKIIKAPEVVRKYGGITTLPHSGVSLIFTTVTVGVAQMIAPEAAKTLSVALPLAALVNEGIVLILSKKAYERAGELNEQSN